MKKFKCFANFRFDSISLVEKRGTDLTLAKRICGKSSPYEYVSLSNELYVHFNTDDSVQRKGFEMYIFFIEK